MHFRLERRLIRGEFRWALINAEGRYVGSTTTYLSAFRICAELNRETAEKAEFIRGESFRRHAVAAVRARKMHD